MDEQTLIERLSDNPDLIDELSREELAEAKTELRAYGIEQAEAHKDKTLTQTERDEAKAAAVEARERFEAVTARLDTLAEADAEADAEAEEIIAGFGTEETEEPEAEVEETETEEAETVEAGKVEVDVVLEEPEAEPALAASQKQPSIGAIAKRAPKPDLPRPALVASASAATKHREFTDAGQLYGVIEDVWKQTTPAPGGVRQQVASFDTSEFYTHEVNGDEQHDAAVINDLLKDANKGVEALVATGGICAPSQPVYDFFSISQEEGLVQLPGVSAPRGRLTYPVSSSYATIRANTDWANAAGQQHTNAEDESGTSKNTFQVTCPSTTTCTVDAYPVILQFGNFQQRFYPEFVAHSIAESMRFHTHFVNESLINAMVTASTLTPTGDTGGGGLVNVANLIGFEASKYRDNFRMDMDARLVLVAPTWVRDALVADYVARNATTSWGNARGAVADILGALNLDVQWVSDYQSIADADDGGWPSAADMLLYAPGTFVRLDGGSLNLGIVRDSTLNATNDFQTFTETFEAICEVGHDSWLLDGVVVCPRGIAAADATLDCNPGFGS